MQAAVTGMRGRDGTCQCSPAAAAKPNHRRATLMTDSRSECDAHTRSRYITLTFSRLSMKPGERRGALLLSAEIQQRQRLHLRNSSCALSMCKKPAHAQLCSEEEGPTPPCTRHTLGSARPVEVAAFTSCELMKVLSLIRTTRFSDSQEDKDKHTHTPAVLSGPPGRKPLYGSTTYLERSSGSNDFILMYLLHGNCVRSYEEEKINYLEKYRKKHVLLLEINPSFSSCL